MSHMYNSYECTDCELHLQPSGALNADLKTGHYIGLLNKYICA